MSDRRLARAGRPFVAALAVLAALGCVSRARDDAAAARALYERCVAESGERACAPERERMLAAQRAYQESAQRAWGCDPAQGDCPTRR
jgi:hypothetical protein